MLLPTRRVIASGRNCYWHPKLFVADSGVVAEIECSADADGYYSSRGLLLTLNVVTDAGNFYSLPFAD